MTTPTTEDIRPRFPFPYFGFRERFKQGHAFEVLISYASGIHRLRCRVGVDQSEQDIAETEFGVPVFFWQCRPDGTTMPCSLYDAVAYSGITGQDQVFGTVGRTEDFRDVFRIDRIEAIACGDAEQTGGVRS